MVRVAKKCKEKGIIIKNVFFLLLVIIFVPPIILDSGFLHKWCCFNSVILLRFTIMVKCLPEFEYFTVFLKNRNFISKNKRSKVTDYAAALIDSRINN